MPISQTRILKEVILGHDGPTIPEPKRVYFQERLRGRFLDFLLSLFEAQQRNGLTKAKLARRIGKSPEVVNRWLGAPSNLTLDSISDLLLGMGGYELEMGMTSLLDRSPTNRRHTDDDRAGFAPSGGEARLSESPPPLTSTSGSATLQPT